MFIFDLWREKDESGVSGKGHILSGVCFNDGIVVIRWESATPSTAIYQSMSQFMDVHIIKHPINNHMLVIHGLADKDILLHQDKGELDSWESVKKQMNDELHIFPV